MRKVVIIDSMVIGHRSIFSWGAQQRLKNEGKLKGNFITPIGYNYFNTCMSILKKVGITRDDLIILAGDGRSSWRKAFLPEYKATRKELRAKQTHINWDDAYSKVSNMEEQLDQSTNWTFIKLNKIFNFADLILTDEGKKFSIENNEIKYDKEFSIEADDIQAVACRYFKDREIILVTIDEDLDQLMYYDNVKVFNPNIKYKKSKKGFYKIIAEFKEENKDKALQILNKKIKSGDISDNIIVDKENDTEYLAEIRKLIISLLTLPSFVEEPIIKALDYMENKTTNYATLPCIKSLGKRERFDKIYDKDNIVSMEASIKTYKWKKEEKSRKNKEANEKRKTKKESLRR